MASQAATATAQMIEGNPVVSRRISNPFHPVSLDHFCSQTRTSCLNQRQAMRPARPAATARRISWLSFSQSMSHLDQAPRTFSRGPTRSTGTVLALTTLSATLPRAQRPSPERPWQAMTMISQGLCSAW